MGKRLQFSGYFLTMGRRWKDNKYVETPLIGHVQLDDVEVADHLYLQGADGFSAYEPQEGESVRFTAHVSRYRRRFDPGEGSGMAFEFDYGLYKATNVVWPDRQAPHIQIPDARPLRLPEPPVTTEPPPTPVVQSTEPPPPTKRRNKVELLAKVEALAEECGGLSQLKNLIAFLED
jgi:hypothetical protein